MFMMEKHLLTKIKNNEILNYFLQRPSFLSEEDENKLLNYIRNNDLKLFYDDFATLVKNTREINNNYIYLLNKMESQNLLNDEIKNQVCWRLFNLSSVGWLEIHDPEIIEYCKNNTTDENLIKEINKIENIEWYNSYYECANLERQILSKFEYLENDVEKYFEFLNSLLKENKIEQRKFNETMQFLEEILSISRGKKLIGSLISEELQEKLCFK